MRFETKRVLALLIALLTVFALAACGKTAEPADTPEPAPEYVSKCESEQCSFAMAEPVERGTDYAVAIRLENRADAPMTFIIDAKGYNGWYLFSESFGAFEIVEPGETKETSFTIDGTMLALYGIERIDSLAVEVRSFLNENEAALDGVMTLNLTDDAKPSAPLAFTNEQTLIDENGVRVTIGNPTFTDSDTCCVMLRCENSTDADLQLSMENFTYNGGACSEFTSFAMPAGVQGYAVIWINTAALDEMGMELKDLTALGFDLKLEDWNAQTVLNRQTVAYSMK